MSRLQNLSYPFFNQEVYYRVMNNGMNVYYIPKSQFQEFTAILTVNIGSVDNRFLKNGEEYQFPEGVAHFLEHQLFERESDGDVSELFSQLGAESNAYTTFDKTSYFFSTTDNFEESLHLLLSFTKTLQSSEETVVKERGIIGQEIAMYQDDADFRLYSGILANLYPNTPLAADVAGSQTSISDIDLSVLKANFDTFYRADFKSLVLVGNFDVKALDRVVRKYETAKRKTLPDIKRGSISPKRVVTKSSIRFDVTLPKLAVGYRGAVLPDCSIIEQKVALRLFMGLLFGWTSQTYQDWYDRGKIDDSFDIEIEITERFSFVVLMLDTVEPIAMSRQLRKKLENVRRNDDVSENHLELLKHEFYGEFMRSLDSIEELGHQFLSYLDEEMTYFDFPDLLRKLDLERVLTIGNQFFQTSEKSEFTIFPK